MNKFVRLLAALMCACMLFTSCAPMEQGSNDKSNAASESTSLEATDKVNITSEQKVQNLEKLCKVWGYTKYNHPTFLLGKKDWDEELLNLIPVVSKTEPKELNGILHDWFISLGKVNYGTKRKIDLPPEEQMVVQADISWISEDYLGAELTEDLSQFGEIPNINRSKAPVRFPPQGQSILYFNNEKDYPDWTYSKEEERLLGMFRVWNVMEYYFPYQDIMDESWHDLLTEFIPKALDANDLLSFELVLAELTAHLNDAHVTYSKGRALNKELGVHIAPLNFIRTKEGQWVVSAEAQETPLQIGDVILKLDGTDIKEVEEDRKKYLSVPNDEKLYNKLRAYLIRSHEEEMQVTVLRDGKEETITVKGADYYEELPKAAVSHEILDGNIGLINPGLLPKPQENTGVAMYAKKVVMTIMDELRYTDGLIIDLRQYPSIPLMNELLVNYFKETESVFCIFTSPSQSIPGTFVPEELTSNGIQEYTFYYDKPVVVLMNEQTQSNAEFTVMNIRSGDNVTVIGSNSIGADGNVSDLPLPAGGTIMYTSYGVYTPEMGQTQRVGLSPDIEVYPTVEGIKEGRDELKEAAVKYLTENK